MSLVGYQTVAYNVYKIYSDSIQAYGCVSNPVLPSLSVACRTFLVLTGFHFASVAEGVGSSHFIKNGASSQHPSLQIKLYTFSLDIIILQLYGTTMLGLVSSEC